MPVGWDTHSFPSLDAPPQEVLNNQLLRNVDLLIAIFSTRIGTPTSTSQSGTIEEISKHIESGKPVMVYFSSVPVSPESIDPVQLQELNRFKEGLKQKGLYQAYGTIVEFRSIFQRQLQQIINSKFEKSPFANLPEGKWNITISDEEDGIEAPGPKIQYLISRLSKEAKEILIEVSDDPNGMLQFYKGHNYFTLLIKGKDFIKEDNPRTRAIVEDAVDQLRRNGLINKVGYDAESDRFSITHLGFKIADTLKGKNPE